MNSNQASQQTFLNQLVQTKIGQTLFLSMAVEGEETDEGLTHDQVMAFIDDPKLAEMAIRHHGDEMRHAQLFRKCLERLGLTYIKLPDSLKMTKRIQSISPKYFSGIKTSADMTATCAMAYILEDRGIIQYTSLANAFDAVDRETAETFRTIIRDEHYHLEGCQKLGKHYAADDQVWEDAVIHARQILEKAIENYSQATMSFIAQLNQSQAGIM